MPITCPSCGANNKVRRYSVSQLPICGRCGSKLSEPAHINTYRFLKKNWAWVVLIGLGGSAWIAWTANSTLISKQYRKLPREAHESIRLNCMPIGISSGVYRVYTNNERIAPFKIVTPAGFNYFAKLVDSTTKIDIMSMYVIGGQPLEVDVPLGSYRLKYANGNIWCGEPLLFGEKTTYGEAQSIFKFSVQRNRISGYTIELIPQENGNLRTKSIHASEF